MTLAAKQGQPPISSESYAIRSAPVLLLYLIVFLGSDQLNLKNNHRENQTLTIITALITSLRQSITPDRNKTSHYKNDWSKAKDEQYRFFNNLKVVSIYLTFKKFFLHFFTFKIKMAEQIQLSITFCYFWLN